MIGNLTEEQIIEVLKNNTLGRIGCNDGDKTYVVPVSYAFEGHCIFAHSMEGMKINMMRNNPDVCFEVDEVKSYTNWKSVILWGTYQELTDERARYDAMKLLLDKFLHVKISQSPGATALHEHLTNDSPKKPIIYRIVIKELSGKFENE